ncbi:hypothetical protein LEP1GSC108_1943 [Leptospira weilii str. UI 13098]|uniref:Uncharacterized protein n=1 Tax=Leptospira weilii str. UI 13098 TaxID=1088542 RepID=M6Q8I4_9LEPT|nr:hypothetical protein LEP1GSC108_1943 [Leptospira weilii str. UI 13098]
MKLTSRRAAPRKALRLSSFRATYLAILRERDLSLGKLCAYVPSTSPKHRPIGRCLLRLGNVVPEFP